MNQDKKAKVSYFMANPQPINFSAGTVFCLRNSLVLDSSY